MGYQQLTTRGRYLIVEHKSMGWSLREIGKALCRSASTISRELRRNADSSDGRCRLEKADSYATWAAKRTPNASRDLESSGVERSHDGLLGATAASVQLKRHFPSRCADLPKASLPPESGTNPTKDSKRGVYKQPTESNRDNEEGYVLDQRRWTRGFAEKFGNAQSAVWSRRSSGISAFLCLLAAVGNCSLALLISGPCRQIFVVSAVRDEA